jgi:hypothetical protein
MFELEYPFDHGSFLPAALVTTLDPESPVSLERGIRIKLRIAELCNGERKSAFFS